METQIIMNQPPQITMTDRIQFAAVILGALAFLFAFHRIMELCLMVCVLPIIGFVCIAEFVRHSGLPSWSHLPATLAAIAVTMLTFLCVGMGLIALWHRWTGFTPLDAETAAAIEEIRNAR